MRVLHVGWGFTPLRPGGLIAYAEDVMEAQLARGHKVSYFLAGRHYPAIRGPRLKRWRRNGVAMFEVINSPVIAGLESGTRDPDRDLSEPRIDAAFARILDEVRPEVVHVQELMGLPSSLLEVAASKGVPTLMTLQDYFPLCATLRLWDADGRLCTRLQVGEDCVVRNARAPATPAHLIKDTIDYEITRARRLLRIGGDVDFSAVAPLVVPITRRLTRARPGPGPAPDEASAATAPADQNLAAAFQRRRDVNAERLGRVDRLIAQSARVAEIYRARGVTSERMTTLPFTLSHLAELRPRRLVAPPSPVVFATLNGCASPTKGAHVVTGALRALHERGLNDGFRLRVYGYVDDAVRAELEADASVELRGLYQHDELDSMLDAVDVGLMPSVWEEAFGYTGMEMIAKGVPLIANPVGGIVEYAREGQTAWLNRACSAEGLAESMAALIERPEGVVDMHRRLMTVRDELIVTIDRHVDLLEGEYRAIAGQSSSVR
jgi:glycosyltransferase involved in cell wall biosynthesis